jgi:hypothetical protein
MKLIPQRDLFSERNSDMHSQFGPPCKNTVASSPNCVRMEQTLYYQLMFILALVSHGKENPKKIK